MPLHTTYHICKITQVVHKNLLRTKLQTLILARYKASSPTVNCSGFIPSEPDDFQVIHMKIGLTHLTSQMTSLFSLHTPLTQFFPPTTSHYHILCSYPLNFICIQQKVHESKVYLNGYSITATTYLYRTVCITLACRIDMNLVSYYVPYIIHIVLYDTDKIPHTES